MQKLDEKYYGNPVWSADEVRQVSFKFLPRVNSLQNSESALNGLLDQCSNMKNEIMYLISNLYGFNKVKTLIDDWIDYYNHDRYQWDLLKVSPSKYYEYLTTGYYPLPIYKNKENK